MIITVIAFLAASLEGQFAQLLEFLDPEVVFRTDRVAQQIGASAEVGGAEAVAKLFLGRATNAQMALINDLLGAIVAPLSELLLVLGFTFADGKIVGLSALAEPEQLRNVELALGEGTSRP